MAYAVHAEGFRRAALGECGALVSALRLRMTALTAAQRFEDAALHRDRLVAFVRAAERTQRLTALATVRHLVAARRDETGGWEIVVIRHGRLAATGRAAPSVDPRPVIDALVATAEEVEPGPGPTPRASSEEMTVLLRWLASPGTRLVEIDGRWCSPAGGAGSYRQLLESSYDGVATVHAFDDRRALRPQHRPARS